MRLVLLVALNDGRKGICRNVGNRGKKCLDGSEDLVSSEVGDVEKNISHSSEDFGL